MLRWVSDGGFGGLLPASWTTEELAAHPLAPPNIPPMAALKAPAMWASARLIRFLTLETRNAILNMVDYIGNTYQLSREHALATIVAVDLKVSNLSMFRISSSPLFYP